MVPRLQLFGVWVQRLNFYTDRKKNLFSKIWATIKFLCLVRFLFQQYFRRLYNCRDTVAMLRGSASHDQRDGLHFES